jgi:hypothetical protein
LVDKSFDNKLEKLLPNTLDQTTVVANTVRVNIMSAKNFILCRILIKTYKKIEITKYKNPWIELLVNI